MILDPNPPLWIDQSDRVRLVLRGPDRAKFLHNLTTNEIKRRSSGSGCETFLTSLQGKTLGYGTVLVGDQEIVYRTDPGGLIHVLPLFEKYGLFDDVQWDDNSFPTFEFHVAGRDVERRMTERGAALPGPSPLDHLSQSLGGRPVRIIRESPFGIPGLTILGESEDFEYVRNLVVDSNWRRIAPLEATGLRIEAGTPQYGREVCSENLPQEIGRDALTISFVKGCYLGQETVARIDALGHVNKTLKGLLVDGPSPIPDRTALLSGDGKPAGLVTSSAVSARSGRAVALAILRVAHASVGTPLSWSSEGVSGSAIVADLPMIPVAERTSGS